MTTASAASKLTLIAALFAPPWLWAQSVAAQSPNLTPFTPFQIVNGVYYVGSQDQSSYLISTRKGLILINSGYAASAPLIQQSVEKLGFKFRDIKLLLISHAHIDHDAGSAAILEKTGARYAVMEGDASVVESGGGVDFQNGSIPAEQYPPARVDRVLRDNDTVELGGTVLTAHKTAGHTKGCTTWTFDTKEDGRVLHVLILCGVAASAGPRGSYELLDNADYPEVASDFEAGFRKMATLPCDVFLGAHGRYFGLKDKYAAFVAGDKYAFIDPAGYHAYVADARRTFDALLKKQRDAAAALASGSAPPRLDANSTLTVPLVSPDVRPDRSVIFRIAARSAATVQLRFDGRDYPMTRDERGVWNATAGPVVPGVYEYSYEIGGARVDAAPVEVPGAPAPYDVVQDVPHGTVTLMTYFSKVQNRRRNLRVYLPPQYYTDARRKFPVLYLYNGSDEVGWTAAGRANVVMDNHIAANKAVPMVIVMPNNNINDGTGRDAVFPPALDNMAVIEKELQSDIFPLIQKTFRVHDDRANRAIAGLSFGGGTAFGVGTRHLDLFAYIGEFGTGLFGGADAPPPGHTNYVSLEPDRIAPGMVKRLLNPETKPEVLYMSVGDRDPRAPHQKKAYEDFRKAGVDVSFRTFPGGHEVKVFRPAMAEFVTLIFK